MRILATYNIKGGVGKTATAVNLAYLAALSGNRTLLWDLDPQGAASFYFRIKARVKGGGAKLLRGDLDLDSRIRETDFPGLHVLPADFSYRNLDLALDKAKKPIRQIERLLRPLSEEYDLLISLKRSKSKRLGVFPFFCMVDRRRSLHKGTADLSSEIPIPFMNTEIPYSSLVEQMGARRAPLHLFARSSKPAQAYELLLDEIREWFREGKGYYTKG